VFGLRTGVGVGGHVTLTGVLCWLLVVGLVELAVVGVELAFRLLRFVVCEMRTIMAAALAVAALSTGCAHAVHADPDSAYISNLKSHGLHAPAGMTESQWEKMAIDQAHTLCDLIATGKVMSRDELLANSVGDAKVMNDAAVATYCPHD
jgi:hypothetical protein